MKAGQADCEPLVLLGSVHAHRSSWCSRPRAPRTPAPFGCRFRLREGGVQSSGGQPTSLAIPSGINGGPSYNYTKYAYYSENANPLWGLSVGLSVKSFYFLTFSLCFDKLCNTLSFASLNAHFSLDRKPVRSYIRLLFTAGVHSGFLGAGNPVSPLRTDCQSTPTTLWLLRAFRDLRDDLPIEHGKDRADEYLDN